MKRPRVFYWGVDRCLVSEENLVLHGVCGLQTMCPQYISLAKMGCHFGSRIRTLILQDRRLSKSFKGFCGCNPLTCFDCAAMADSLFDFELLESADVLVDFDADEALNAVAAAETAQLETDQDEMAILADYVVPPNKTPEDLARDLEAMVSGVNTLSLQATDGGRSSGSRYYLLDYPTGIFECSCCGDGGTSQRHGEFYPAFFSTGNVLGASACPCSGRPSWRDNCF